MMLSCKNLWKVYGNRDTRPIDTSLPTHETIARLEKAGDFVALADVGLTVEKGETLVIMGLSGSGKSTLLRCLTRLIEPTTGTLTFSGDDLSRLSRAQLLALRRQHMSMVFQHFALLPNRTVCGNVELPLEIQGISASERRRSALEMIRLVGLSDKEDHYPSELSGGQQQRVGIARSLCTHPTLWLLDEPFSSLDPLIRREMQDELIRLQKSLSKTAIFVTHDFDEAARIGDRIALLRRGQLVQCGTAADLVLDPADDYVRAFTANAERSRIMTAERFMERGAVPDHELELPVSTTLYEISKAFADGRRTIAFSSIQGEVVGFMRRQNLGEALATATMI
jgi:glycine betaine/proline transport system ATP-binding protein